MAIARGAIVCRRRRVVPSIISRLRLTVLLPGLSIVLRLTVLLLGLSIVLLRLRVFLLGLSIVLLRLSVFLLVPLGSPQCQNKLGQQDYGLRQKKGCSRHLLDKKCLWKTHDWSWNARTVLQVWAGIYCIIFSDPMSQSNEAARTHCWGYSVLKWICLNIGYH